MNKKLHILFINSWYPSRVMPTNGDFIQRHAEAVAIKNEVTAIHIVSDKKYNSKIEITDEVINGVRTIIGYTKATKNPFLKHLRFIKTFVKIYKKIDNFHIVHVNRIYPLGIFALYLKYFKKKSFIISEHWTGFLNNGTSLSFFEKTISKTIIKNATFVCPVSQNLANSMIQMGFEGNYRVIPNVVNTNIFIPKKSIHSKFTMLHVSSMIDVHKNITGLLNVLTKLKKEIPDFKLILIGNDSDTYIDYIDKLSIKGNIEIIPQIEHCQIADFMQKADAFILFSNYENLPCVILESFSCGLPVISTDVGGISEFFPSDFGYLISKGDEQKLLEKILELSKNPISKETLMHNYAKDNFSEKKICSLFTDLYLKTLAK